MKIVTFYPAKAFLGLFFFSFFFPPLKRQNHSRHKRSHDPLLAFERAPRSRRKAFSPAPSAGLKIKIFLTRLRTLGNCSQYQTCYQCPLITNIRSETCPRHTDGVPHSHFTGAAAQRRKGQKNIFIIYRDTIKAERSSTRHFFLVSAGKFHFTVLFLKAFALFTLKTGRHPGADKGRLGLSPCTTNGLWRAQSTLQHTQGFCNVQGQGK